MPTAVTTARQCLTEESARALDDAVSVAKRRNHAQTTSLHAVSALLSPSFSLLRDSLTRCRSTAYSPRLQFRALELCVGVSLDRLPSSKTTPHDHQNDDFAPPISNSLMAAIKSRVFGEAGFRSSEIKLAILHPPRWGPTPNSRCPPLFLCNLMDFPGYFGDNNSSTSSGSDENCKRIGEVMAKKREKNPLLVGVCAKDALSRFKDCVMKQKFDGLPVKIHGLKLICFENEIMNSVIGKCENEVLDLKVKEVRLMVESSSFNGPGIVINVGELKVFIDDESDHESVKKVVLKLSDLVQVLGSKIWLIGFAANYETYSNFVGKFSSIEKDWDLHPLPITSSRSSFDGFNSKSSLMGSFVPFGGFFPTPSDYSPPITAVPQSFTRCNACNEKYEHELGTMQREGMSVSLAEQHSAALPSWLQSSMLVPPGVTLARLQVPQPMPMGFPLMADTVQGGSCSSGESSLNERACSSSSSGMQIVAQNVSPQQQLTKCQFPKQALVEVSQCQSTVRNHTASLMCPISLPPNQTTAVSVTTDLGLGTIYTSKCELNKPFFQGSISTIQDIPNKKDSAQTLQSSFEGLDPSDYKPLFRKLSEVVAWQGEAISRITEVVLHCKSGNGRSSAGSRRGNVWLSFLGPDKIGKKKIAEALADGLFGSRDRLITVDLSSGDNTSKINSLFICQGSRDFDISMSRITVADHIAQELCKKPHSVVFLENIDEADLVVQNSLSHAIQSGKFQDSRGREIGINNMVFVTTSTVTKDGKSLSPRKEFIKFQEEKILEARNWQMQLEIRTVSTDASRDKETTVSLLPTKSASPTKRKLSDLISDTSEHFEVASHANKIPKNSLDLNLPLEDVEEAVEMDSYGRAWLEDFLARVDGDVVFKPFDFDALADKLLRKMRSNFEETYKGEKISLEIDHEVMVQILAAAWSSDGTDAVDYWLEQVLYTSFAEAREKYHLSTASVVRLSSCEGVPVKEWVSGISLPKSINLGI
ncbi:Protein SMAX1-LIKE 7 [Bienertia sinuspersici]